MNEAYVRFPLREERLNGETPLKQKTRETSTVRGFHTLFNKSSTNSVEAFSSSNACGYC